MAKATSRQARWNEAIGAARTAFEQIQEAAGDLDGALEALKELKGEYEDWLGNLPDSLQSSPVGEKLQAVVDLDLDVEVDLGAVETALDEAEGAELPQGFGRD